LTSDVTISTSAWTDIVSLSLGAGTWVLFLGMEWISAGGNNTVAMKATDGTTDYAAAEHSGVTNGMVTTCLTTPPIVLTSTTTLKMQAKCAGGSSTAKPSTNYVSGVTNKSTYIMAMQIA